MEKPSLAEIRIDVALRREQLPEKPHYQLPAHVVESLLKKYKRRAEKITETVERYYDEPNKRIHYEKLLEKVELVIYGLENPILAKPV